MNLYLATSQGLITAQRAGNEWRVVSQSLTEKNLTCLAIQESHGGAGTNALYAGGLDGVYRSTDNGKAWQAVNDGLTVRHTRWMAGRDGQIFLGTEPADIFVLNAGDSSWRECPEVTALRDKNRWFLPYSPEAGCVRGFAFHGGRAYAAVEVGGALRSDDGGTSWQLCRGSSGNPTMNISADATFHPDVHSIEVHPSSPDLVYAPDGGGFYRSRDGGATWQLQYACYVRAVWIDPADPEHIVLGPADGVSRNGRIEESGDGGKTWQPASNGQRVPWRDHMVERFLQVGGELLAVLSNGQLLAANLGSEALEWRSILAEVENVNAAAVGG